MTSNFATLWGQKSKFTNLESARICSVVHVIMHHFLLYAYNYIYILFFLITGIFYYSLGNLRPFLCSKVNQIQLLALVKLSYIGKYSMNKVLEPFVKDVAVLVSGHCVNYANNDEIMILLLQEKG